jgi:sugar phosphate isomerase/epimerase
MQIGCSTHPRRELISEIHWIGVHGFDFVDLFLEPDGGSLERLDPLAVRSALAAHGLGVVGHMAWYLPIGSPMRELRETAVAVARSHLAVFRDVGARRVTIHAHWPPSLFTAEEGIGFQVESLLSLTGRAGELGLQLQYEPVGAVQDTSENTGKVLDRVPGLLCHLDIGHCNLNGRKPDQMIRELHARLSHLHIHDNDGLRDLHLPPGTGCIEWPAVAAALREVGYDGTVTVEVFSPDRDYLLMARDKVRRLLRDGGLSVPG